MGTDPKPVQTAWPIGGGYTTKLAAPKKFSDRWAVQLALQDTANRTDLYVFVCAAAIAVCDPEVAGFVDEAARFARREGLAAYGAVVIDYLTSLDPPATPQQIVDAGQAAVALCREKAVTQAAIQEAADFSSPQPAASTSNNSTSSATGDSSLVGWVPSTPPTPPR
jgi:hypothetical protein